MWKKLSSSARWALLIAPLLLIAVGLACGNTPPLTVTLREADIDRILEQAVDAAVGVDVPVEITNVDIEPGVIRVFGSYVQNGIAVPGSADLTLRVENGMLRVEVTSVDVMGLDVDTEMLADVNEQLSRSFSEAASQGQVTFTGVEIVDGEVRISFRVNL
ncbi:MAG: LmeA family phospholipid-binding protein [Anaerolineae bacterium]|nr:LmeA family phospholipid-binding protein [Anaerolineae bacterium]